MECVSVEKDLGVIVSDDLKSKKQYSAAVMKANRMLRVIRRNFADSSKETIMSLYTTLVRPHLEYCSHIWSPHYDKDIKFKAFREELPNLSLVCKTCSTMKDLTS